MDETQTSAMVDALRSLPGVRAVHVDKGEVVAEAERRGLLALMATLREDDVAFEVLQMARG